MQNAKVFLTQRVHHGDNNVRATRDSSTTPSNILDGVFKCSVLKFKVINYFYKQISS